jgi:hypothetical protein
MQAAIPAWAGCLMHEFSTAKFYDTVRGDP